MHRNLVLFRTEYIYVLMYVFIYVYLFIKLRMSLPSVTGRDSSDGIATR
jgi:hypothetical protein